MTIALPQSKLALAPPAMGIGMALVAFALFSLMDTSIKILGGHLHVLQVALFNSVFALLAVVAIGLLRGGWRRLRPSQWRLHVIRWCFSYLATIAIFWAYPRLPLADVYAILFASPLLVTALSVPVLGEQVGWRRWAAVGLGFLGVLIILGPGSGMMSWPAVVALLGAAGHAMNMLVIRKIGRRDEPVEAIGIVGNLLTCLVTLPMLPWVWVAPSAAEWGLAAVAGSIAGGAFILLAASFRAAPAALIASFQYSQMVYALVIGWLLFADLPDRRMLLGAAVIIASGLYILQRETRPQRAAAA
jgi:drug/metabolite transporter (DMT)-like permease